MGSILEKYNGFAGGILEEYKKQLNDESLTDEEVMQRFKEDEKKFKPRNFSDVFADVMAKYNGLNRSRKREILKLIKKSNAARGGKDYASTSTNS